MFCFRPVFLLKKVGRIAGEVDDRVGLRVVGFLLTWLPGISMLFLFLSPDGNRRRCVRSESTGMGIDSVVYADLFPIPCRLVVVQFLEIVRGWWLVLVGKLGLTEAWTD